MMTIRIIKHEAVPKCGSFEVRFADGRPSRYWYFDDIAGRRLRPEMLTSEQALEQARMLHEVTAKSRECKLMRKKGKSRETL